MNGGLLSLISFYMSFKVTPNRILSCLEGTSAASRRNRETGAGGWPSFRINAPERYTEGTFPHFHPVRC